jgi:hypothetical protein
MNRRAWLAVACVPLLALGWAAFAPVPVAANRERPFVIPDGTWARRMAGDKVEILPRRVRLTLGVNDVLALRNRDRVPQTFGPALLMPGQVFRLPFEQAAEYSFACSAHAAGEMTVVVEPFPASPWGRVRWRLLALKDRLST